MNGALRNNIRSKILKRWMIADRILTGAVIVLPGIGTMYLYQQAKEINVMEKINVMTGSNFNVILPKKEINFAEICDKDDIITLSDLIDKYEYDDISKLRVEYNPDKSLYQNLKIFLRFR